MLPVAQQRAEESGGIADLFASAQRQYSGEQVHPAIHSFATQTRPLCNYRVKGEPEFNHRPFRQESVSFFAKKSSRRRERSWSRRGASLQPDRNALRHTAKLYLDDRRAGLSATSRA
jgi:hypothetical protein